MTRPIKITRNYLKYPEGSCLIQMGNTKVLCTASITRDTPDHAKAENKGWLTAEYSMLPRATNERTSRGRIANGGRTKEISRLIGRSLRAVMDLSAIPDIAILIDCDVIQADGGTRCASITGAFVALVLALGKMKDKGQLRAIPVSDYVAATSVGIVSGMPLLDLAYEEDSKADVDMNIVKTSDGRFIEIQGTAEAEPFGTDALTGLLALADKGINDLVAKQREIVGTILGR